MAHNKHNFSSTNTVLFIHRRSSATLRTIRLTKLVTSEVFSELMRSVTVDIICCLLFTLPAISYELTKRSFEVFPQELYGIKLGATRKIKKHNDIVFAAEV